MIAAHLKGEEPVLKERYEVEITHTQRIIVECDKQQFNEHQLNRLFCKDGPPKTVENHVANISEIYSQKKTPGVYGDYGLVSVDGEIGGRAMPSMYELSGVNVLPVFDNSKTPVIAVRKIKRNSTMLNQNE